MWKLWRIWRLEVRLARLSDTILRWQPGEASTKALNEWRRLHQELAVLKEGE